MRKGRPMKIPVLLAILTLSVALTAAPILPLQKKLPDEIRCLAGIHRVSLTFAPLPKAMRSAGVSENRLRAIVNERLQEAWIKVVEDPSIMPQLVVSMRTADEVDVRGVEAFALTIDVQQRVAVLRIERNNQMMLPTATFAGVAVAEEAQVVAAVERKCRSVVDSMLRAFNRAQDHKRLESRPSGE